MQKRHVFRLATAAATFLLFAAPALANTTNLSFDPSYAAQPFSFFCQPYKNSFETGKHYVAQNNDFCTYSIPSGIIGTQAIAIYKGTPGNSTFVTSDHIIGGAPTLVKELNVNFGSPLQDQNYFGVVYGFSSPGEEAQFDTAFRTGSSTNTLPPSSNYNLIQWKWGSKPAAEYDPVIIIPDILNSWSNDTGQVIDPVFHTYQNLIDTFVDNGYVLNQTLFPLPYDWQNSNVITAQTLQNKIQAIKATCGCLRVDIIGHGMGGFVAEQYIQSVGYQNDIDQLVLLGTPISGVPAAYQAWEGGQITFGSPLADGLAQVFLNAAAKEGGYPTTFGYVQGKPVASFKELLPTYDYLFAPGFVQLFYPSGYPQNTFLENLLSNLASNVFGRARVTTVLGDDALGQTTSSFLVSPSSNPPVWPDGQPSSVFPDLGDGMVPRFSIENYLGNADTEFTISHRALPTAAQSYMFNLFNNKAPSPVVTNAYPVSCVLFLTTTSPADMQITDPNGNRLGKNFSNNTVLNEIGNSFYSGFNATPEYGLVVNPINGVYQIRTQGSGAGNFSVNASDVCGQNTTSTSTNSTTAPGQLIGLQLTVATSTQTLTLASLDINPPTVIINNPANNHAYFNNATTSISITVTDPENSPTASTVYRLNGTVINGAQPINFSTLPLGTSTLVVAATDVFNNTGYATSSFSVIPPPDTGAPVITITLPQQGHAYLTTDSVIPSVTITDPENSTIAGTTYTFNGATVNPALALPFGSAPIGSANFVVTATDAAGNKGYATSTFTISAPAVTGSGACAVALNATAKGAITLAGSTQIKGTNCGVQVNSNASGAVNIAGSAKITSTKNCFVGTLTKAGSASATPNPVSCTPVTDPFASHAKPTVGACTQTNYSLAGSSSGTLNPGVYCGGITVAGSAKVTLNPGIYVLNDGDLNVAGSASVTGNGVSLFMTGAGAGITLAGSGKITITAPTSGMMAGFAIFLDPSNANGTPMSATTLAGSGVLNVQGVIYLPRQQFSVAGSATNAVTSFVALVADTINIAGSPTLTFTIPTGASSIPVPPGL